MDIQLSSKNDSSDLSYWALHVYSIIRTIKDTIHFNVYKDLCRPIGIHSHLIDTDQKKKIIEQVNELMKDISFSSIYSEGEQYKIITGAKKLENFCFETMLSHYLVRTKPGREYSFYLLNKMRDYYDDDLLKNVKFIRLFIAGTENKQGRYFFYRYGHCRVLGGARDLSWVDYNKRGRQRANTCDLSFLINYNDASKKQVVILGEVEGNHGLELLKSSYWDDKKPDCALFGIGIDRLNDINYSKKELVTCRKKIVPVILFPDPKSELFSRREIFQCSGLHDLLGYTYKTSFQEFMRFLYMVRPRSEYLVSNFNLSFIFSDISKSHWDTPFEELLDHIENEYIIDSDSQESLVASGWRKECKHVLNITPEEDALSFVNVEESWDDPFDRVFSKQ